MKNLQENLQQALQYAAAKQSGSCEDFEKEHGANNVAWLAHHGYIKKCCAEKIWFITKSGNEQVNAESEK